METRDRERREVMRTAVGALHHNDFRRALKLDPPGSEVPILAALYDDPVSMFFGLAEPLGSGYLVTLNREQELVILKFTPSTAIGSPEHDDECPIHPNTEIGMLVEYVRSVGGPVRCSLYCPGSEIEVIDEGGSVEVPA